MSYWNGFFVVVVASSVTIPFKEAGISVEEALSYVKIEATIGLIVMWNRKDSLWVCVFLIPDT